MGRLHQSGAALFQAVAGDGAEVELILETQLDDGLTDGLGQAAAAGKDTAEIGSVVDLGLFLLFQHDGAAVEEGLELLKGQNGVDIGLDLGTQDLRLLGDAGADEDDIAFGIHLAQLLAQRRHGRQVVRLEPEHILMLLFDVVDKGRAAGRGQEALLDQLAGLFQGDHIGAQRDLDDVGEAQRLDAGHDLTQLGALELAGDGRSDEGIDLPVGAGQYFLQAVDNGQQIGLVGDGAEGALIDTGAAVGTLGFVDLGNAVFVHGDGAGLAVTDAGTLEVVDGAVGADAGAAAALDALGLVDAGLLVFVEIDGVAGAGLLAAVGNAATAVGGDQIARYGAFVAGDVDDLDDLVGVFGHAVDGDLDALGQNGALFIDAAAHGGLGAGGDQLGDAGEAFHQVAFEGMTGHLTQNFIAQVLNLGIKSLHGIKTSLSDFSSVYIIARLSPAAQASIEGNNSLFDRIERNNKSPRQCRGLGVFFCFPKKSSIFRGPLFIA